MQTETGALTRTGTNTATSMGTDSGSRSGFIDGGRGPADGKVSGLGFEAEAGAVAERIDWAGRVADLGNGTAHDGLIPTTASLAVALRTALTPETRSRANAVAGTIRTDGATVAAKLLLDAVSQEKPPAST